VPSTTKKVDDPLVVALIVLPSNVMGETDVVAGGESVLVLPLITATVAPAPFVARLIVVPSVVSAEPPTLKVEDPTTKLPAAFAVMVCEPIVSTAGWVGDASVTDTPFTTATVEPAALTARLSVVPSVVTAGPPARSVEVPMAKSPAAFAVMVFVPRVKAGATTGCAAGAFGVATAAGVPPIAAATAFATPPPVVPDCPSLPPLFWLVAELSVLA
jgi:hypothetical protein